MTNSNYTLALHVGHNSSAALMKDGKIIVAVCEERSRRKKNYVGYPKNAVDYCLVKAGVNGKQLNRITYTSTDSSGLLVKPKTTTHFTLQDYRDYYAELFYKRKLRSEDCFTFLQWLRDDVKFNNDTEYFDFSYITDQVLNNPDQEIQLFRGEQARLLGRHLGIDETTIEFLDHHTCHAYYSYFGSPFRREDCIALTLDGWGDGRNQTVWKVSDDLFTLLAESNQNDLGRIYKMATLLLGMRPDEHEFKVMGLATYAKSANTKHAKQVIENICTVDGMRILSNNRPEDLFSYLEKEWKVHRFDNIAGAVQSYTEEIACELVKNIVQTTGVRRFVIGGGIAMNIKMIQAISELEEVEAIFVCGSPGDESLSIGGCYVLNSTTNTNKPMPTLYLGYDIRDEIENFDTTFYASRFEVNSEITFEQVAALLANGDIVGVIRGRAEFGARALGNRSILANPSRRETVQKINEAIKNRDFWMPFSLSILEERHDAYIRNPKKLHSPFMTLSLDVHPETYRAIEAGTHPYDKTVRPQSVSSRDAPEYHALITAFQNLTGIPALLNTSLNLHGEPIVDTISDAILTFEVSGLDHLLIEDRVLLSKRKK